MQLLILKTNATFATAVVVMFIFLIFLIFLVFLSFFICFLGGSETRVFFIYLALAFIFIALAFPRCFPHIFLLFQLLGLEPFRRLVWSFCWCRCRRQVVILLDSHAICSVYV